MKLSNSLPRELYRDLSRDNPKHAKVFRFIDEYCIDLNGTKAAIRAGYSPKTANEQSTRMLANVHIKKLIDEKLAEIAKRNGIDQDYAIQGWKKAYEAKFTEFANIVIVCCRYCHGKNHGYQFTKNEYKAKKKAFDDDEISKELIIKGYLAKEFDDEGGIGFDGRKKPHKDCPECFGDGKLVLRINPTDTMTDEMLLNLKGFKRTKGDYEIVLMDKEKALDAISRYVGLYEKENKVIFETPSDDELRELYWNKLQVARERQRQVDIEREQESA